MRQHLGLHQARRDRLLLERARAQHRAVDARALLHQRQQVDLGDRTAAPHADHRDAAAGGQRARGSPRGCRRPTSSRITSNGPCSPKPSGAITCAPRRLDLVAQLLAADGGGDPRAGGAAELHRGRAHSARGAVHQQALARAQRRLGEERVVRGGEHLGQAARLPASRARPGTGMACALVHHRELGLAASAHHRHHPVALREAARPGPRAATSPASSRPGMSCGSPGGAG